VARLCKDAAVPLSTENRRLAVYRRYNTVMKLVFLGTSSAIVYYMRYHRIIKLTYDKEQDTFKYLLLVAPAAVLALLTSHVYTVLEVCSSYAGQLH
jgi:ER lumen protein retaining receptor